MGDMHLSPEQKARISRGMRELWRRRNRDDVARAAAYHVYRSCIYQLEGVSGDSDILAVLYQRCLETCPPSEQPRWRKRLEISDRGRRVKLHTSPAEIFAGDDLHALQQLRAADTVAALTD